MISDPALRVLWTTFLTYVGLGAGTSIVAWLISLAAPARKRELIRFLVLTVLLLVIAIVMLPTFARPMRPRDPFLAKVASGTLGYYSLAAWWVACITSLAVGRMRKTHKSQNKVSDDIDATAPNHQH